MLRQSNLRRTPATEARSDPLFEQYPQNGEFRLQSGVVVKTPFHAYQADACILAGTVDASAARRLLRPTGLEPVLAARDRAYAEIWVTDYQDTGLGSEADPVSGAYTEAAFAFLASAGTTTVPWRNRFSPLKAAAMEQSWRVIHQLVLPSDKQVAIDYGREILGLDKQPGTLAINADDAGISFRVVDSNAAPIFAGKVVTARGLLAKMCIGIAVFRALGPVAALKMLFQSTTPIELASKDLTGAQRAVLRHGHLKRSAFPNVVPWHAANELSFGAESALGRVLREVSFTPTAVVRIDGWRGVLGTEPHPLPGYAST